MKMILSLAEFIHSIFHNKSLIWELTKKELQQRYLGSYLGILWAFIQPVITVFIFWFVFQVGFRTTPTKTGVPFILWLLCGMFPWFFVEESVSSATESIINKSFLVKKIVFEIRLLPIIQILAAIIIHLFFVTLLFIIFAVYNYMPDIYNLQIFYYLFYAVCLVLGLSWITSSLSVFSRDIAHLVKMLLQFMFWGTPIFWNIQSIPERYAIFISLNPMFYVIEGYRDAFIYKSWFWESPKLVCYYWTVTFLIMCGGIYIFQKLRPHFADIL